MQDKNKSQSAFDEIKDYSTTQLSTLLGHALAHIDKFCNERLTDFAAKTEDKETAEQVRGFLITSGKKLSSVFIQEFSKKLAGEKTGEKKKDDGLSLSLVDDDILEEMLLVGSLSGKIQDHYELYLKAIKRGLVRLSKQMGFEVEPEALAPKDLAMILHHFFETTEFILPGKKLIYSKFAEILHIELEGLYDGVLALMQDHQIITESENPASEKFKVIYEYRQQHQGGGGGVAGAPAAADPTGGMGASAPTGGMPAASVPPAAPAPTGGMPAGAMPGGAMPGYAPLPPASLMPVAATALNANLFSDSAQSQALYNMLSGAPVAAPAQMNLAAAGGKPMPAMDSGALLKLLSNLQNLNTLELAESALGNATAISDQINKTVYGKARELSKQLSGPESNVIELINQMFVTILEDPELPDIVKVQIGRLQIPYIKVALLDVTLLKEQAHPARLLLNEVAIQGRRINSREDQIFELIAAITQNILEQFETNLNVFADNLEVLREQTQNTLQLAAEAEEETREKAVTQAELLHIKKRVISRLRQFLQGKKLPKELHAITLKGFAPLFLKIYRREGEDSPAWEKATSLFRRIVESVQPRDSLHQAGAILKHNGEILAQTQTMLESAVQKAGVQDLLDGLKKVYQRQAKDFDQLKKKYAQEGITETDAEKIDPLAQPLETLEEPPELANQPTPEELLQRLPVDVQPGTWCEVYMGRDQAPQRLKVSSVLKDTAQIVFVDGSGKQAEIKDVREFIDELDCERSTIIHDENLFDKALTAVLSNMKLMRGASATA
ncbi:MAG TPA: DUF1631 family protein [Gammaproteobacteria bacterium]|nr:DUF1631 family protein [Gammaproteobacteria bacterium]